MSRWLLALVLAAAGSPGATAHDALSAIDVCLAQLDRGLDVGYQRIAARCPDLTPSLMHSQWAAWLPRDWNQPENLLSADGLTELRTLLAREPASAPQGRAPRVARVAEILATLTQPDQSRGGWWARFRQWLREALTRPPQRADPGWLRRMIADSGLSQAVLDGIVWGALVLVMVLAAAVVMNELRIAGIFKRRHPAPRSARAAARQAAAVTLQDLEHASLLRQPTLLLELITARLGEQDRLPPARALTVHELTRAARLPEESDRERLMELAAACERLRFSGREPAPLGLAAALARGRELLAALDASVGHAQGAR
ncbi:MAG TPA: hypothetical protein VMO54_06185 [Steroidobacteraceae bacterium]|nr:hypothetical protein [Steroidobacteraceae bacterium]